MTEIQMQTRHPTGQSPLHNLLLAALPWDEYERLVPALQFCVLEQGRTFHEAGDRERHMYFITSGIVGKSFVLRNGDSATFALTGPEGAVGIALLLGAEGAPSRSTVITGGTAWRLGADWARAEFERNGALLRILLRYTQALMAQTAQTAVCNQHHSLEQRLCRLVLSCLDRLPSNDLALTQQAAADILGVRRESVSEAAGRLERLGLIRCGRGHIKMVDRPRMQAHSCECYAAVRQEYERSAPAPLLQLPETCAG
jgi:CRP-like cAMP-binding protein